MVGSLTAEGKIETCIGGERAEYATPGAFMSAALIEVLSFLPPCHCTAVWKIPCYFSVYCIARADRETRIVCLLVHTFNTRIFPSAEKQQPALETSEVQGQGPRQVLAETSRCSPGARNQRAWERGKIYHWAIDAGYAWHAAYDGRHVIYAAAYNPLRPVSGRSCRGDPCCTSRPFKPMRLAQMLALAVLASLFVVGAWCTFWFKGESEAWGTIPDRRFFKFSVSRWCTRQVPQENV